MLIPVAKIQARGIVHHQLRVGHHVPILRTQLRHGLQYLQLSWCETSPPPINLCKTLD